LLKAALVKFSNEQCSQKHASLIERGMNKETWNTEEGGRR
jgi:hypothetical protein